MCNINQETKEKHMVLYDIYKCNKCEKIFYYPSKYSDGSSATEDSTVVCPYCGYYGYDVIRY